MNTPARHKPRKRKSQKSQYFHGAPDEVCGRAFALPDDVSLSGDCLDWGKEFTAKIQLPEKPKPLAVAFRGALSDGEREPRRHSYSQWAREGKAQLAEQGGA